ncbi:unnamed protein product [Caenorhabditis brenneri]
MAEFLENNLIALRHCLLYVFLQEKSAEKAFDGFCETVGNDVIKRKEFQYWFDQFKQGKFGDKEQPISDIREVIRSDKQALRACVMYEWLTTKNMRLELMMNNLCRENRALPVFAKYQNFCKVIGDGIMEYPEFEFWFYRFFNGEYDLNFERDKDKKLYELVDMPIDIMKNILDYLDTFNRMSLAKTSRSFKEFIEDQKLFKKKLEFRINFQTALISFDNHFILIEKKGDDCLRRSGTGCLGNERLIRGVSHWKQAIHDFASILKLKNLYLDNLKVDFVFLCWPYYISEQRSSEAIIALEDAFKSVQQLNVKHFTLDAYSMESLLNILPSFKPGYLSKMDFFAWRSEPYDLEELSFGKMGEIKQWKQAKYLNMSRGWLSCSLHHFYHFEEFNVRYRTFSVEDVREMKKILFNSADFKKCTITAKNYLDMDAIGHEFGNATGGNSNIYHYPIPDSMEMADYLKSNPVALRHCLLYEYLQRNPYKRAFTNIRDTIGNDVFSEEELRSYFSQFRKRKMDGDDRRIADMRDVLRNDKHALRACILYEFFKYKLAERGYSTCRLWPRSFLKLPEILREPSFSLFNNFCKKLGDDVMEYREFDFWFYRFVNGEFDLNYEREKDKKIYELVDLPIDITRNVVEYLHIFDRVSLAQTSRSLETFVEDQKIFHQRIEFEIDEHSARISSENRCRKFTERSGKDKLIQDVPHWKQGIQELKRILKCSELYLEEFSLHLFRNEESEGDKIKIVDEVIDALEVALKSIRQVHAKTLSFRAYSMKPLLNILPSLKPGYLSKIDLNAPADSCLFSELRKLEQWKQAKCFKMIYTVYVGSLLHLYHFKEFHVSYRTLAVEDIRQIKEILFNSPDFEKCIIELRRSLDMALRNEFGDAVQEDPDTYHYPSPNSEEFFEVKLTEWKIIITRKQKSL